MNSLQILPLLLTFAALSGACSTGFNSRTSAAHPSGPAIPPGYTLLYQQDFEGPTAIRDFVFTDPNAWKLSPHPDGTALHQASQSDYAPPVRSPRNIGLIADKVFGDFILEADLLSTGREAPHRDLNLYFGFQDPTHFYYIHIASRGDAVAHHILIVNDAPRVNITRERNEGVQWTDSWHRIRLERTVADGTIRLFFDDMENAIMEATDTTFSSGYVGFGSFDDSGLFDNIRIWGPRVENKPTPFFTRFETGDQ
jgi:hypothetical protein